VGSRIDQGHARPGETTLVTVRFPNSLVMQIDAQPATELT
jgi:hypothetical protein